MAASLNDRVCAKLRELAEKRGFLTAFAKRTDLTPSAITPYVNGSRQMSLDMLEALSEMSQIPIAELVAPPGSLVKQLAPDESALLRALRLWPKSVRQSLLGFVTFFAEAETPAQTQTRNLHELWRGMRQNDRDWLYGLAVMMREGLLPPDLREGLADRIEAEARAKRTTTKPPRPR